MERLLFRNLRPLYSWLLIVAWFAILVFITWVFLRDGGAARDPFRALVIAFFWGVGCWMAVCSFARPIVSVWQSGPGDWLVTRRWLWTHDEQHVNPDRLPPPVIETDRDGEGGGQYFCLLETPEGPIAFCEHDQREKAAQERDRMASLIRNAQTKMPLGNQSPTRSR